MKCVDRPFVCESCEFRFEDLDSLRLHKRKMEGVCDSYCPFDHELYTRKVRFPSTDAADEPIKSEIKSPEIEIKPELQENSEEHQREVKHEPYEEPPPLSEISPAPSFVSEASDCSGMSPSKPDRFDPLNEDENDDIPVFENPASSTTDKLREVRVRVKTISPFVHCPYCNQEYNIDDDSDAAFRLVIHVANQHPKENITFR